MESAAFTLTDSAELTVKRADITRERVGAIVVAADPALTDDGSDAKRGGGGGGSKHSALAAVHRVAGPELLEHCRTVPEVEPGVRCPTGEAIPMPPFRTGVDCLIMTSGPVYDNDVESGPLLRAAYRNSLRAAAQAGCASVALPLISVGDAYGYPPDNAADEAVRGMLEALRGNARGAASDTVVRDLRICSADGMVVDAVVKAARRAGLAEGDSGA